MVPHEVDISGNGASGTIDLRSFFGTYVILLVAETTLDATTDATIQVSADGVTWAALAFGAVSLDATNGYAREVPGGLMYRLLVSDFATSVGLKFQMVNTGDLS